MNKDDREFAAIIQAQWDADEANSLQLYDRVRVDLTYLNTPLYSIPMQLLEEHGHGLEGVICDKWRGVDGFYVYNIDCDDKVIRGAYSRRDLVKI
jgi:hypothetical protein